MSEAPDDDVASRIRRMLVRLDGLPDRDRDSIRVIGAGTASASTRGPTPSTGVARRSGCSQSWASSPEAPHRMCAAWSCAAVASTGLPPAPPRSSPRRRELLAMLVRLTTYANHPRAMSADVAIQMLQAGLGPGVRYLERGWDQLVDALAATHGARIAEGRRCRGDRRRRRRRAPLRRRRPSPRRSAPRDRHEHRVARLLVNLASWMEPGTRVDPVRVNGQLGWYVTVEGRPELVLVPSFRDGRVASVLAVLNPDKLARFHAAWLAQS